MNNDYKQGEDRNQALLLPPSINDYVDKDNGVRVIDMYIDILDIKKLNFTNTRKSNRLDGQKAYYSFQSSSFGMHKKQHFSRSILNQ